MTVVRAVAGAGPPVAPPLNHPAVGTHFDLDLLRIFRVPMRKKRPPQLGHTHCSGGSSETLVRTGRWE